MSPQCSLNGGVPAPHCYEEHLSDRYGCLVAEIRFLLDSSTCTGTGPLLPCCFGALALEQCPVSSPGAPSVLQ